MESTFDKRLNEISAASGVIGVSCSDQQGLCLGVRGKATSSNCAWISNIADIVSQIEPSNDEEPVVLLDSNNLQCLIQKDEFVTVAIFKTHSS